VGLIIADLLVDFIEDFEKELNTVNRHASPLSPLRSVLAVLCALILPQHVYRRRLDDAPPAIAQPRIRPCSQTARRDLLHTSVRR